MPVRRFYQRRHVPVARSDDQRHRLLRRCDDLGTPDAQLRVRTLLSATGVPLVHDHFEAALPGSVPGPLPVFRLRPHHEGVMDLATAREAPQEVLDVQPPVVIETGVIPVAPVMVTGPFVMLLGAA